MVRWWRDLSVSKKLYGVVGVMALLIASELFTLLFAMEILSAVRSFVGGEGLWSKAQKNAVHSLHRYAFTHDRKYYEEFHKHLEVPMGDRAARLELEKPDYDIEKVTAGFVRGGVHPDDVPGLVKLIRRFYWIGYIDRALTIWREADRQLGDLMVAAEKLDKSIRSRTVNLAEVDRALAGVDRMNEQLTVLEIEFSEVLGAGSRWLENLLMIVLILAVLTVEATGLGLTVAFSRNLSRSLKELSDTAEAVGRGNFDLRAPVRSRDELGQLAGAINKMSEDLKSSTTLQHRAESASQVKTQFLANMSHEIRTPLNVILGLTEILKDPALAGPDHRRYVETIERTGHNLTRIINDILDISKVEAGHLEIESNRFSFSDFMSELQTMLNVQAKRTENELRFVPMGEQPKLIVTDRTRLRQILVNLVNNALKYTRQGEVRVAYWQKDGQLVFDVEDTGRGIAEQDRERLFQAFTRFDESGNKQEGTGLGLMLSKKLAHALGGDVQLLRTQEGKGSTFRATVREELGAPLVATPAAPSVKPASAGDWSGLQGRKALVVEDSEDNQLLVKLFLSRQGIVDIDFAANGQEGVERALSGDHDFVLMDMQMPIKDGYNATRELRERGFEKPIIALTAHAMKEDRERCMKAGCSDYLTKPIESKALFSTLARHLDV